MDKDVNSNTSCTGKATLTLTTHGLTIRTYTHLTFSKSSILPTLPWLDKLKYKRPKASRQSIPIPLYTYHNSNSKDLSAAFISISSQTDMSRSSSPIYIPSHSASPKLTYPDTGNTPFPPVSPTPFMGNTPIPLMNTHTSTPNSIPTYVQDYEDAANDLMVAHMTRMIGLTSEEAMAFIAMHQSVLEPFLCSVSPPPRPPTPPTPEPLILPPRYHNLSPEAPDYNLPDSEAFPLPPLVPCAASPAETHVSYSPSPTHNPADDTDEFPNGEWPSNPPSPVSSNNVPVL